MGDVQNIVQKFDIVSENGFDQAMKEMISVPEGELYFILSYEPEGQSREWKQQYAIANAELARRTAVSHKKEQERLTWYTAGAGIVGVLLGAVIQVAGNMLL